MSERWIPLKPAAQSALTPRDYTSRDLAERLRTSGVEAGEIAGKSAELAQAWIPGVEIFGRRVYVQRHRGIFGEFARQGEALVVVLSAPAPDHKIPLWEQELSAGAAAMNLLSAAHAMGYVGGWLTGWRAYSPMVNAAFAQPGERIAGFVFLGSPGRELEERPRPDPAQIVRKWDPPAD